MHVELVDLFRCTRPHEDAWLVAVANDTRRRVIVDGVLGCPVCGAAYPIHDGLAHFGEASSPVSPSTTPPAQGLANADPFRLAALLDLDRPGRTVVLCGYAMSVAHAMLAIAPARIVLVNVAVDAAHFDGARIAAITTNGGLPVAAASLDGMAIAPGIALPADLVSRLQPGGRLVAPATQAMPPHVREIARDATEWVAERDDGPLPSALVTLRRQSPA